MMYRMYSSPIRRCRNRSRESGAVLVISLVLLVTLTLLGVAAMNTSQLEEKMAANTQESTRAFQAAETGISEAFADPNAWNTASTYVAIVGTADGPGDTDANPDAQTALSTTFIGWSPPPPESLYSATSFQAAHFDFQSESCTDGSVTDADSDDSIVDDCAASDVGLSVVLHAGAYQIAPKQN